VFIFALVISPTLMQNGAREDSPMNISFKCTLVIGLLLLMPLHKDARAQSGGSNVRIPKGIYAVVPVEEVAKVKPEGTDLNTYFKTFYKGLLSNPAVSGLALQIHWDTLNPRAPTDENPYEWDDLDVAFSSVHDWNNDNPGSTKTIQLIVSPGFNSPSWLLNSPKLATCDGLFEKTIPLPVPPSSCGEVTFTTFAEQKQADGNVLPLPWNLTYENAWFAFLKELGERYNEKPFFISIAVAGPTAVSAEILLPNSNGLMSDEGGLFHGTFIPANQMWEQLLSNLGLPQPETSTTFFYLWGNAIGAYARIFNNLTLVVTTGNGLPDLITGTTFTPATSPINLAPDCKGKAGDDMDCNVETTILDFFAESVVGGTNGKATQTSGLEVQRAGDDLGINGVKFLSQYTMGMDSPSTRILGGAQFNEPVSINPNTEGSYTPLPLISPEQALYNVLGDYFNGTPAGGFFGEQSGTVPLNYLQVYHQDIRYATNHASGPKVTINVPGGTMNVTFQELLNLAGDALALIGEQEP
jgi:hypothetical protein